MNKNVIINVSVSDIHLLNADKGNNSHLLTLLIFFIGNLLLVTYIHMKVLTAFKPNNMEDIVSEPT